MHHHLKTKLENIYPILIALALFWPAIATAQMCEVQQTKIPSDIAVSNTNATASTFQQFSWDSFLGLNAASPGAAPATGGDRPLWTEWSSTVDMLSCLGPDKPQGCECVGNQCTTPGARFYPTACRGIAGYQNYRTLDQMAKFDDSFLQAATQGLSNAPVVDQFGDFVRFEILVSPVTYQNVVDEELWNTEVLKNTTEDLNLYCGTGAYDGGDPANSGMGDIVLKVAWMDLGTDAMAALDEDNYYTEDMLVYTPGYRNTSGAESCEVRPMAMVGMHIAHKTARQPNWIWSTFEHRDTAPNCTEQMTNPGDKETNKSCPDTVSQQYLFNGTQCDNDDPTCGACNTSPASNDVANICRNPTTPTLVGWCLDQQPANTGGTSRLCRHTPVYIPEISTTPVAIPNPLPDNYPQAAAWNQACVNELTADNLGPWQNYMLISGQWLTGAALPPQPDPPAVPACVNVAGDVFDGNVKPNDIRPLVASENGSMRPFLSNMSMESYDKSNCIGCHAKAIATNDAATQFNTDFMYFLTIGVAEQDANFMSYEGGTWESQCTSPDDPAVVDMYVVGEAINSVVADQMIDLKIGVEIPDNLPVPMVSARDATDPSMPWMVNGQPVVLNTDPSCLSGTCEAALVYPPAANSFWLQYLSSPSFTVSQTQNSFAGYLRMEFPGLTCGDIDGVVYRSWLSDNSQTVYANQIDGSLVGGSFVAVPPGGDDFDAIPTMGRLAALVLILLMMLVGVRAVRSNWGRA